MDDPVSTEETLSAVSTPKPKKASAMASTTAVGERRRRFFGSGSESGDWDGMDDGRFAKGRICIER